MIDAERRALAALRFNLAPTPDDVWRPSPFNVADQHKDVVESIFEGVSQARTRDDHNPLGVVVQGTSGAGKTHVLTMVRTRTQHDGGYFFLVSLLSGKTFWESTALCIVDGLLRECVGWKTQLKAFLRRLTSMLDLPAGVRDAICGDKGVTPADLDSFIAALRRFSRVVGQETQDTARALVLYGSVDLAGQDLGYAYLNSLDLADVPERSVWGVGPGARSPQLIVRDISRLLALTGSPTVIAIDQMDTLFAQSTGSVIVGGSSEEPGASTLLGQVADGLMTLREVTRRTLVVVACLPDTWELIRRNAATPVPDRFREAPWLGRVSNAKVGLAIVRKRLDARYGEVGFTPPYPTWPVREVAFTEADHFTPRALLKRVERHASECLRAGRVRELIHLDDDAGGGDGYDELPGILRVDAAALAALDAKFETLVKEAAIDDALSHATEDQWMPLLLAAGMRALIEEIDGDWYKHDPLPSAKPALHARLRLTLDERLEDEWHWAFRAISSTHPTAVITRIRAASTMAGLDAAAPMRRLYLLRNQDWPTGPKTSQTIQAFHDAGGVTLPIDTDDLRVFDALRVMQADHDEAMSEWLASRTPASRTQLFQTVLDDGPHST
ncbi:MAG TPA: hypothetical protein VF163_19760 [Micromonosporaceae bacterium]